MINVDENKCIGCGACVAIDGEHFGFNDQGLSTVIKQGVTDSVKEAKDSCPVDAISVDDVNEETEEVKVTEETKVIEEVKEEETSQAA